MMKTKNSLYILMLAGLCSCTPTASVQKGIDGNLMEQVLNSKTFDIPITAIVQQDGTRSTFTPVTSMNSGTTIKTNTSEKPLEGNYYIRVRPEVTAINLPYEGKSRSASLAYNASELVTRNIAANNITYTVTPKSDGAKLLMLEFANQKDKLKSLEVLIDKNGTAFVKANKIWDQVVNYEGFIRN